MLVTEARAVGWEPVLPLPWHWAALPAGVHPGQAMWGWLLPTQPPHLHLAITCPCSQPDVLLCKLANMALSHALVCRELDGHPSYSPPGHMAWLEPSGTVIWGSQKGPWRGSSPIHVTPWKYQHGGFPKSLLFLRLKHLSADS